MNWLSFYLRNKFWIKDYFKGSPIRRPYLEIKSFCKMSFNEAEDYQRQKLDALLKHAIQNTDFYSNYSSMTLSDYPIMNKASLLENHDKICVKLDKIPGQRGKLHIQSTSGSTGTPFSIPQDTNKRNRRIAELKYFGEIVGFKSHEKLVHLRTWNRWQSKTPKQIREENIIPFDISKMGDTEIGELCRIVNKNKAVCLRGYASSFDLVAKYMRKHNIQSPSVKIIIAGSETLHDDVRQNVKEIIHSEIISQYANEECGVMAQERIPTIPSDNPMYLNNASYIFECLKLDEDVPAKYGELGRLIVTDLNNYAFPLIRYDTGDAVIMMPPNEYSNGFPIVSKLFGRRLDICYATNGHPFSPMTIGRVLKHYDKVIQWQFIQKDRTNYLLKVILQKDCHISYLDPAIADLKETLGKDATINVEIVAGIPTLASGKRKPVINEWKKKQN